MWILSTVIMFLGQGMLLEQARGPVAPAAPATQQAVVVANPTEAIATTQPGQLQVIVKTEPSTQPVVVTTEPQTIYDTFSRTRIGQLFRGQQKLDLQELERPSFWYDTIKDLVEAVVSFIPRLLVSVICLVVFWLFYRALRRLAGGALGRAHVDKSIKDLLLTLIKWTVMGFGLVIACNQIGIPIVAMLTGVSIIGLAVGFAAQETLANFIAGVVIFIDKPFKVGDWIEVDGIFSRVQRITFRSTRMLDLDGEIVILPNTSMLAQKLTNFTSHPLTRVKVAIGIAYKASIDQAREVLLKLAEGDHRIVSDPAPSVVVDACADSSVNLLLRLWTRDESLVRQLRHEYLEKAKKALEAADIEIPFPHVKMLVDPPSATHPVIGASAIAGPLPGHGT